MTTVEAPSTQVLEQDREHLIHPLHFPADHGTPLVFVEGRGSILIDIDGKEYIDGLSCLWNVNVGHGRRELAEAAAEQMAKLAFVTSYAGATNVPAVTLATKLLEVAYPDMHAAYFTTGGAESNESAFKTARFYWKVNGKPDKVKFISRIHGYHGVTMAAASATGMAMYHRMFAPLVPNFFQVAPPHPYRWSDYGGRGGDPGIEAAEAIEQVILREGPETVAAVIAEPVMGAGGVIVPPASYFPKVREICDKYDVLLIGDEVITGFCRTGRWFALEHYGVQPDIMSFAKGVTSAYLPLGGILVSERVQRAILDAPADLKFTHAATYSGHPTCCAVAIRNLQIMHDEKLAERAATSGKRLLDGLKTLEEYPVVGDVRGLGMMCGVELVEDKATRAPAVGLGGKVAAEARKRGLYTRNRGGVKGGDYPIGDTICLAPPLTTPDETIDRIVSILHESIRAATA
ncbi:MAG TPA: aspartate aminotransferase family protein [Chloroflexota bacterium]|nr:aspartate aminotransferase family protein [Chloroflexota bacterium]